MQEVVIDMRPKLDEDDKILAHNSAGLQLSGSAGSGVLRPPKMTKEQQDRYNQAVASRSDNLDTETYMNIMLDTSIPKNQFLKIYNQRFGSNPYNQWYRPIV
tara:strand:+ start:84 stop:389 length:306 start_codon:yes stop_codon:yes gene_type:complete